MEGCELLLGDCEIACREANYDSQHKRFIDRRVLANTHLVFGASQPSVPAPTFRIPGRWRIPTTSETNDVEERQKQRDLLWSRLPQMVRRSEKIENRIREKLNDERMKFAQRK